MAGNKKRIVIPAREAIRRLDCMIEGVERDVQIALQVEASMDTANKIVTGGPPIRSAAASTYHCIAQSSMVHLSLCLARIFDAGSKRWHHNRKDIASIPLLVRLLRQRRCQRALVARARVWTPSLSGMAGVHAATCSRSIAKTIKAYVDMQKSPGNRATIKRLMDFRNGWVAHTMMDDLVKRRPTYSDLFRLTDLAREIVQPAKLAIQGRHEEMSETEQHYAEDAERFWRAALCVGGGTK